MLTLIFGNRNYSTWSLRAWLHLTESGISFQEQRIALFEPGHEERMARVSPTGKVPVLLDGDITVWDSWAIIEHARLAHGASVGWPEDPAARAHALGVSAEMHAGFSSVRAELPMNLRAPVTERWGRLSESARTEVERIRASWTQCLERYKGPFLFGALSIADILYAARGHAFSHLRHRPGPRASRPTPRRYWSSPACRPGLPRPKRRPRRSPPSMP